MSKTASIAYLNGEWVDLKNAKVSILDQGILRGDGLFETIRARNGKIPLLHDHLERMYNAAKQVGLEAPLSKENLAAALYEILKKNNLQDARLRVVFTRGVGESMDPIDQPTRATYFVLTEPLSNRPTQEEYQHGVAIVTVPVSLYNALFPSSVKSTSYFPNMAAKRAARKSGAFEAILVNENGICSEGSTSNFFWVKKGEIYSPPLSAGALPGVTRKILVEILKRIGKTLREENIHRDDLAYVDEAFITGSIIGILPVTAIDGKNIGTEIGKTTQILREQLEKFIDDK